MRGSAQGSRPGGQNLRWVLPTRSRPGGENWRGMRGTIPLTPTLSRRERGTIAPSSAGLQHQLTLSFPGTVADGISPRERISPQAAQTLATLIASM